MSWVETNGEQVSMQIVNIVHDLTSDFKAAAEPYSQGVTDGGRRTRGQAGVKVEVKTDVTSTYTNSHSPTISVDCSD